MIHQQTGHGLDILFNYKDHKPVIQALRYWGTKPEVTCPIDGNAGAKALVEGIVRILKEAEGK